MYSESNQNQIEQYLTDEFDLTDPEIQLYSVRGRLAEEQKKNRVLGERLAEKEADLFKHAQKLEKLIFKFNILKASLQTAKRSTPPSGRAHDNPPAKKSKKMEPPPPPPPVKVIDGNELYEVQSILYHRYQNGELEFRIHWKGTQRETLKLSVSQ